MALILSGTESSSFEVNVPGYDPVVITIAEVRKSGMIRLSFEAQKEIIIDRSSVAAIKRKEGRL